MFAIRTPYTSIRDTLISVRSSAAKCVKILMIFTETETKNIEKIKY